MGTLTHAQIVTEALQLAGNTGLTLRAQVWLGLIRRTLYEKITMPQGTNLKGIFVGTAGDDSFIVGSAVAGAADVFNDTPVRGIKRILFTTASSNDDWQDLVLESIANATAATSSLAAQTGRPSHALIEPDSPIDGFEVTIIPTPDQAYRFMVIADSKGPLTPEYSASTVNDWPDDLTVIQGVYALALKHMKDETAAAEWEEFKEMMRNDRVRYMGMNPDNKKWGLSRSAFRTAHAVRPWAWMGPV